MNYSYCIDILDLAGRLKRQGMIMTITSPYTATLASDAQGRFAFTTEYPEIHAILTDTLHNESMVRTIGYGFRTLTFNPETELTNLVQADTKKYDNELGIQHTALSKSAGTTLIEPATTINLMGLNAGDVIQTRGVAQILANDIVGADWAMSMRVGDEVLWRYHYPLTVETNYEIQADHVNRKHNIAIDSIVSQVGDQVQFVSGGNYYTEMYNVYGRGVGYKKQHPDLICQDAAITRSADASFQLMWENIYGGTYSTILQWVWLSYTITILKP